ncbi:uncharacterized protein C8R40DRAFT_480744 [Lentinula edodes]|uniref:uncharacterized protein n=1 Tax=Lentinula edodes TaxID=5353 RepID=UPI001E8D843E|nr:uncharacterized protein C8R40DRAFT_480744 [Lentinula edodes]KAH7872692.1 hypothetical protein C8R40DRAFT_480744 [Lentinula edodes]
MYNYPDFFYLDFQTGTPTTNTESTITPAPDSGSSTDPDSLPVTTDKHHHVLTAVKEILTEFIDGQWQTIDTYAYPTATDGASNPEETGSPDGSEEGSPNEGVPPDASSQGMPPDSSSLDNPSAGDGTPDGTSDQPSTNDNNSIGNENSSNSTLSGAISPGDNLDTDESRGQLGARSLATQKASHRRGMLRRSSAALMAEEGNEV